MSGLESSRWASKSSSSSNQFNQQLYQRLGLLQPQSAAATVDGTASHSSSARHSRTPSPVKLNAAERRRHDQLQNHDRFLRLLPRLKWKAATLLHSHQRASASTDPGGQASDDTVYIFDRYFSVAAEEPGITHTASGIPNPKSRSANAADTMFKLDFFEFYVALERVLVHLLGALGIVINAEHYAEVPPPPLPATDHRHIGGGGSGGRGDDDNSNTSLIGDARVWYSNGHHRFHANVLAALDSPSNPLHRTLGTGMVRQYLGLAKEVRNKWKDVDDDSHSRGAAGNDARGESGEQDDDELAGLRRRYHQILQDIQLDRMLAMILDALDQAKVVAATEVAKADDAATITGGRRASKGNEVRSTTLDDMVMDVDMMDFE